MSVHVIIEIEILNKDLYMEYVKKVPPIVKKYGGNYLARGEKITTLSGNWHPERLIILEFDTVEQVNNWLASPEYSEIASLRNNSTISKAILLESGNLP